MTWRAFPTPLTVRVHLDGQIVESQVLFWMYDADGRLWYMTPGGIKIEGIKVVRIP